MNDPSSSGNRWEPPPSGAPDVGSSDRTHRPTPSPPAATTAALPPRRPRLTSLRLAAAGLVIFLGGGAGGYAVAHASTSGGGQEPAPVGTRTGVPGQSPSDLDGGGRFRGARPGGGLDGGSEGSGGVQPDDDAPGSDT